jgi:hypothetical protein
MVCLQRSHAGRDAAAHRNTGSIGEVKGVTPNVRYGGYSVCPASPGGQAQTELDGGCIRELLRIACGRTFRVGWAMAGAKESA